MDINPKFECLCWLGAGWFAVVILFIFIFCINDIDQNSINEFLKYHKYYNLCKCVLILSIVFFLFITPIIIIITGICIL
jgi:hypothetical protein